MTANPSLTRPGLLPVGQPNVGKPVLFHALMVRFKAAALRDLRDTVSAALAVYERMAPERMAGTAASRPRVEVR